MFSYVLYRLQATIQAHFLLRIPLLLVFGVLNSNQLDCY